MVSRMTVVTAGESGTDPSGIGNRRWTPCCSHWAYGFSVSTLVASPASVRSMNAETPASVNAWSFRRDDASFRFRGYSPASSLPGSTQ